MKKQDLFSGSQSAVANRTVTSTSKPSTTPAPEPTTDSTTIDLKNSTDQIPPLEDRNSTISRSQSAHSRRLSWTFSSTNASNHHRNSIGSARNSIVKNQDSSVSKDSGSAHASNTNNNAYQTITAETTHEFRRQRSMSFKGVLERVFKSQGSASGGDGSTDTGFIVSQHSHQQRRESTDGSIIGWTQDPTLSSILGLGQEVSDIQIHQASELIQNRRPSASGRRSRRGSNLDRVTTLTDVDDNLSSSSKTHTPKSGSVVGASMDSESSSKSQSNEGVNNDGNSHAGRVVDAVTKTASNSKTHPGSSTSPDDGAPGITASAGIVTETSTNSSSSDATDLVDNVDSSAKGAKPQRKISRKSSTSKSTHRKQNPIVQGVKTLLTTIRPHPRHRAKTPILKIEGVSLPSLMLAEERCDHKIRFTSGFPAVYRTPIEGHTIHLKDIHISDMTQSIRGSLAIDTRTMTLPPNITDMHLIIGVNYCFNDVSGRKEYWASTDDGTVQLDRTVTPPHLHLQFKFPLTTCFVKDVYAVLRQANVNTSIHHFFVESSMTFMVDVFRDFPSMDMKGSCGNSGGSGIRDTATSSYTVDANHTGYSSHMNTTSSEVSQTPWSDTGSQSGYSSKPVPTLAVSFPPSSTSAAISVSLQQSRTHGSAIADHGSNATGNANTDDGTIVSQKTTDTGVIANAIKSPGTGIVTTGVGNTAAVELSVPPTEAEMSMSFSDSDPPQECLVASADFVVKFDMQRVELETSI